MQTMKGDGIDKYCNTYLVYGIRRYKEHEPFFFYNTIHYHPIFDVKHAIRGKRKKEDCRL